MCWSILLFNALISSSITDFLQVFIAALQYKSVSSELSVLYVVFSTLSSKKGSVSLAKLAERSVEGTDQEPCSMRGVLFGFPCLFIGA